MPNEHRLARRVTALLGHRASAAVVGKAYLEAVPAEANVATLIERIGAAARQTPASMMGMRDSALREMIVHRQRQDFDQEDVVCVRGWILSATEARLCALAALI